MTQPRRSFAPPASRTARAGHPAGRENPVLRAWLREHLDGRHCRARGGCRRDDLQVLRHEARAPGPGPGPLVRGYARRLRRPAGRNHRHPGPPSPRRLAPPEVHCRRAGALPAVLPGGEERRRLPDPPLYQLNRTYTDFAKSILLQGVASGELRADLPVHLARDLIYGAIEHLTWRYLTTGGSLPVDRLADELADLVLADPAVRRPPATSTASPSARRCRPADRNSRPGRGSRVSALLEIANLQILYDRAIEAVRDVSLSVPEGKVVALLGSNGAGKSTTLKAVAGLLPSEHGEVTRASRLPGASRSPRPGRDRARRHDPGPGGPPGLQDTDGARRT